MSKIYYYFRFKKMGRVKHLRAPLKPKYTVITSVQTLPITLINNSLLLDTVKIKFVMSKYIHYYFEDRICKWPFGINFDEQNIVKGKKFNEILLISF